jgi:phosphoribosylformimino-5-aminoimidazole carboxamide ribotide isomerase
MLIYPAIDIKSGKCVRLTQGVKEAETVYFDQPWEVARLFQEQGAKRLHVIDLDGAFEGESRNLPAIEKIIRSVTIPVQTGGGIRSLQRLEQLFGAGVWRCILGTKAMEDSAMLQEALDRYGDKIVVSVDAKDGLVAVEGWTKVGTREAVDFSLELESMGLKTLVYTDISRDGMMQGPNLPAIRKLREAVSLEMIASGGVSCLQDLINLKAAGVEGAIVGKALYEGAFTLPEIEEAMNQ